MVDAASVRKELEAMPGIAADVALAAIRTGSGESRQAIELFPGV